MSEMVKIPQFKKVKLHSTNLRVSLDNALSDESCVDVLTNVMKSSPIKMQPISTKDSKKRGTVMVGNEVERAEERVRFNISDPEELILAFRSGVSFKSIKDCVSPIFDGLLEVKAIQISSFRSVDVFYVFDVRYQGNHDALLVKIYHKGSILGEVFYGNDIFSGDISIGGLVSREKKRLCGVIIKGSTSLQEIFSEEYDANKDIDIMIGYAQRANIPRYDIGSFMLGLLEDAQNYLVSNVLEKIIRPLDDEVSSEIGGTNCGGK